MKRTRASLNSTPGSARRWGSRPVPACSRCASGTPTDGSPCSKTSDGSATTRTRGGSSITAASCSAGGRRYGAKRPTGATGDRCGPKNRDRTHGDQRSGRPLAHPNVDVPAGPLAPLASSGPGPERGPGMGEEAQPPRRHLRLRHVSWLPSCPSPSAAASSSSPPRPGGLLAAGAGDLGSRPSSFSQRGLSGSSSAWRWHECAAHHPPSLAAPATTLHRLAIVSACSGCASPSPHLAAESGSRRRFGFRSRWSRHIAEHVGSRAR